MGCCFLESLILYQIHWFLILDSGSVFCFEWWWQYYWWDVRSCSNLLLSIFLLKDCYEAGIRGWKKSVKRIVILQNSLQSPKMDNNNNIDKRGIRKTQGLAFESLGCVNLMVQFQFWWVKWVFTRRGHIFKVRVDRWIQWNAMVKDNDKQTYV